MTDDNAPDPLPEPRIRVVRKAVVVPHTGQSDVAHGVFDAKGAFAPMSMARLSKGRMSGVPEWSPPTARLHGTYLYAGFGHRHFGHFMLEGLVRLWALDHVKEPVDGLVLPARQKMPIEASLERALGSVVALFGDGLPPHVIREPTRIDRLILPSAGFGHDTGLTGTPAFRTYIAKRVAAIPADGADKLYLTRTRLGYPEQRVDREAEIEAMMRDAGYFIFSPERYPIETQIAMIKDARQIVGADGSAFHIVPFAMRKDAAAAIFLRRNRPEMLARLSTQMQAFCGITPTLIDARQRPLPRTTPAPIDLNHLRQALRDAGFL
ncbi:glycosyltransferase family 61 protein [Tateyamaria pelophila]|uniref:glycosyltransferase family 61 protein n=1 Tax=Tateyamaria pelophila TaxID=328415 RepID=UPI001CBD99D2|nr:glycosyltransferase 61 family protein [Tateyamaria pelophila]